MRSLFAALSGRISARLAAAGVQALLLIAIARELSPTSFGAYAWTLSLCAVLTGFFSLGVGTLVLRIRDFENADSMASAAMVVGGTCAGVAGLTAGAAVYVLADARPLLVAAAVAMSAGDVIGDLYVALLSGQERFGTASALLLGRRIATTVVYFTALFFLHATEAITAAGVVNMIFSMALISRVIVLSRPAIRACISQARGYWTATIAAQIGQLDVTLVSLVLGSKSAGIYSAAQKLSSPFNMVSSSLVVVFLPMLSGPRDSVDALRRHMRLLAGIGALSIILAAPVLALFVPGVLGQEYAKSGPIFGAMVAALGIACFSQALQAEAFKAGRAFDVARIVGGCTSAGLLAHSLALYLYGLNGMIVSLIAVQLVIVVWLGRRSVAWRADVDGDLRTVNGHA